MLMKVTLEPQMLVREDGLTTRDLVSAISLQELATATKSFTHATSAEPTASPLVSSYANLLTI
jgi:hypothetical protein